MKFLTFALAALFLSATTHASGFEKEECKSYQQMFPTTFRQCTTLIAGGAFMYKKHALVFEVRNHGRWSTVVTTLVPIVGEQRKKGTLTNASHITVEAEISSKIRDPVVWAFGKTARYTRENINRQWTEGGMTVCIEIWDTICMDVA